jgi:hypothetical protein
MHGETEEKPETTQNTQSLGQDLNPKTPTYEAGVLTTQPLCSVPNTFKLRSLNCFNVFIHYLNFVGNTFYSE